MTDSSMNFGPAWIRNLHSEGTTTASSGGTTGGTRYQLAEYRYGREEMLALFDKSVKPPPSLGTFKTLYSEQTLIPLALLPTTEEEQRTGWQSRPTSITGVPRGRGSSLERGGRVSRGRGGYQGYGRAASAYDSGWGNGEQPDWSPRKEYSSRSALIDNWRRTRSNNDDDDGWRNINSSRSLHEKWGRSQSWRGDGDSEERNGPPERGGRPNWHENNRGGPLRRSWDNEDHLPEWANENPTEGGGTFDERGAFHGSDDEQDSRKDSKRDMLQKSTSQQHIPHKTPQAILSSSKSTSALSKPEDNPDKGKEEISIQELNEQKATPKESSSPEKNKPYPLHKMEKTIENLKDDKPPEEMRTQLSEKSSSVNGPPQEPHTSNMDKVDEDFDRLQEDLVLKLVVDEETPKTTQTSSNFDVPPPPNLVPPSQEKWYYQDPQGTRQGPFTNVEMAEWYKAGYFSNSLNVMRECDERYFLLGELINLCGGENPFLSNVRFPVLKNEPAKLPDDMLPYQFLSQFAFKQQMPLRNLTEPWNALTLQQQELAAQRLLLQQQQQQIPPDLPFMQQSTPPNPLLYMINQMQQTNKLPGSVLVDKPSSSVPSQMDPLMVQMGNMHSLQNRMQTPGLHNHLPGAVPANLSSSLPTEGLGSGLSSLQTPPIPGGISSMPGLHGTLPSGLPGGVNVIRPTSTIDPLQQGQDNDPLTNFLKQFQQPRPQQPLDSLWQKQNQFNAAPVASSAPSQWPQQSETPLSMWDLQTPTTSLPSEVSSVVTERTQQQQQAQSEKEKERPKEEVTQKELKKRKEQEEKQAKKETEERRKQEQRKQEVEKKAAEEKKKKEEEKIRKELEKVKKEAEEKRLRELEEKRRLKEQRKAEEEARKKSEEMKRVEEEKNRREMKEREEKKQVEAARLAQNQSRAIASKTAPWSQSNFTPGVTLTEIQKAEKERKAQETALQLQKQQLQEQQQQQIDKNAGLQLNWAKKPIEPRKVKSLAEIQAEEAERMAKVTAEAKLAAQLKEKETPVSNSGNIWNGQSLTWANASTTSQWSSNSTGGFWDEVPTKSSNKPSTVSKSNSTSAMTSTKQQQQKQSKNKNKKEESPKSVNNNNNQTKDEFTEWCYKTLANISADVDIPTFVTFLRDIESAYDVRDYCKEYLGESSATQQFASNFLEKRRSCKPKNNAHKDDMCSPAPAITPSTQHSTEFQEVKGKNKKNKKSKMLKVDSRILGFNVTSAPDRINVGDRDYGDNS